MYDQEIELCFESLAFDHKDLANIFQQVTEILQDQNSTQIKTVMCQQYVAQLAKADYKGFLPFLIYFEMSSKNGI